MGGFPTVRFDALKRVFQNNRGVELPNDELSPVSFSHDRVSSVNILYVGPNTEGMYFYCDISLCL